MSEMAMFRQLSVALGVFDRVQIDRSQKRPSPAKPSTLLWPRNFIK
jgi:hypothetical protein